MLYEEVYSFLIGKLRKELPKNITYHNVEHTIGVVQAASLLADKEGIGGDDKNL
jgi:hypothetical protein